MNKGKSGPDLNADEMVQMIEGYARMMATREDELPAAPDWVGAGKLWMCHRSLLSMGPDTPVAPTNSLHAD